MIIAIAKTNRKRSSNFSHIKHTHSHTDKDNHRHTDTQTHTHIDRHIHTHTHIPPHTHTQRMYYLPWLTIYIAKFPMRESM